MKKLMIVLFVLNVLNGTLAYAESQPIFKSADPGTADNLKLISTQLDTHSHTGIDGSQQIPKEAAAVDNAIVSDFRGQIVFNSTDFEWCGSTQTGVSTAWVKLQDPTTACGH